MKNCQSHENKISNSPQDAIHVNDNKVTGKAHSFENGLPSEEAQLGKPDSSLGEVIQVAPQLASGDQNWPAMPCEKIPQENSRSIKSESTEGLFGKHFGGNVAVSFADLSPRIADDLPLNRHSTLLVAEHPFITREGMYLQFFQAVSSCLKGTDSAHIREKLDADYILHHRNIRMAGKHIAQLDFDWVVQVDHNLLLRKSGGCKIYKGHSVTHLVDLIRDKAVHYQDMVEELRERFFNSDNSFSEEKYVTYFLNLFPDIVTFLFRKLAEYSEKYACLATLKRKYF